MWSRKQTSTSDPEANPIMSSILKKLEEVEQLLASLPDRSPRPEQPSTSRKRKMETQPRFFPARKKKRPGPAFVPVPDFIGNTGASQELVTEWLHPIPICHEALGVPPESSHVRDGQNDSVPGNHLSCGDTPVLHMELDVMPLASTEAFYVHRSSGHHYCK